jgi:hypothetical protein
MSRRWCGATTVVPVLLLCLTGQARAVPPRDYCRQIGTDDTLRPIDRSLLPAAVRVFHLERVAADEVLRSTYFRCAERHVFVCTVGANLPCGKADTRQTLPGTDEWCAAHPGSDFIPMVATGHDTIYRWRCNGSVAAIAGRTLDVDRRGFIAQYWRRADVD